VPATATEIVANLYYQTISKEYIEFLKNENIDNVYDWNNWGKRLYASWESHGKSQPVLMNSNRAAVQPASADVGGGEFPVATVLMQNYPNPFNPTTDFGFRIADFGLVSLRVFDVLGREVATIVNENKQPGTYTISWDAGN